MRLILIRHGQTPANVDGVLESTVPGPGLTPLGEEQAAALPAALAGEKIGAIFVSSMVRTHLTAAALAADRHLEPYVRDGLREISAGDVEGNTDEASVQQFVHTLLAWCDGELNLQMPGGEVGRDVIARFDDVVDEAESLGVETVAFVSHGAIIRAWCTARTNNIDLEFVSHHYVVNTGIVAVERTDAGEWEVVSWLGESVSDAAAVGVTSDHSPASEPLDE